MIGKIVAAAKGQRAIDQASKGILRECNRAVNMVHMQVEDNAGPTAACPRQRRLSVAFNQPHGSVDDTRAACSQMSAGGCEESAELGAGDVQLGNHLRSAG